MVKFPREESGKNRKLSQPRHGPYRVLACNDPDLTVAKVYRPQDGQIQIHQERVTPWPSDVVSGYYWYGRQSHSLGRLPKWIEDLSDTGAAESEVTPTSATVDNEEDEAPVCETDLDETDGGDMPDAPAERTPSERYGLRKKVTPQKGYTVWTGEG